MRHVRYILDDALLHIAFDNIKNLTKEVERKEETKKKMGYVPSPTGFKTFCPNASALPPFGPPADDDAALVTSLPKPMPVAPPVEESTSEYPDIPLPTVVTQPVNTCAADRTGRACACCCSITALLTKSKLIAISRGEINRHIVLR